MPPSSPYPASLKRARPQDPLTDAKKQQASTSSPQSTQYDPDDDVVFVHQSKVRRSSAITAPKQRHEEQEYEDKHDDDTSPTEGSDMEMDDQDDLPHDKLQLEGRHITAAEIIANSRKRYNFNAKKLSRLPQYRRGERPATSLLVVHEASWTLKGHRRHVAMPYWFNKVGYLWVNVTREFLRVKDIDDNLLIPNMRACAGYLPDKSLYNHYMAGKGKRNKRHRDGRFAHVSAAGTPLQQKKASHTSTATAPPSSLRRSSYRLAQQQRRGSRSIYEISSDEDDNAADEDYDGEEMPNAPGDDGEAVAALTKEVGRLRHDLAALHKLVDDLQGRIAELENVRFEEEGW